MEARRVRTSSLACLLLTPSTSKGNSGYRVNELFVTDGTTAGTQQLTQHALDGGFSIDITFPRLLGSTPGGWVYIDSRPDSGKELWLTDAVNSPTQIDLWPGANSSSPLAGGTLDGDYLFFASTADRGNELWRTDGTVSGTEPLDELHLGPTSEVVNHPTVSGSQLYFAAIGPNGTGEELWAWEEALFEDGFETVTLAAWSP